MRVNTGQTGVQYIFANLFCLNGVCISPCYTAAKCPEQLVIVVLNV